MRKDKAKGSFGGIQPSLLSAHELGVMLKIEQHLKGLSPRPASATEEVWPVAERREDRVILLDGDRGAGKTSLMWAMVERWGVDFHRSGLADAYGERAELLKMRDRAADLQAPPDNIRVLGILDFDPLPPSMPVVAGLVQSWRRLADKLSQDKMYVDDDDDESVMDSWQNLFRKAAAGWGKLGERKTLIDQVLDQEEQIQDWQTLGLEWRSFVERIIKAGAAEPYNLSSNTAFVIMIDDCDLQVERMREILPAIRLLYDHNVYFIVSADRSHMLDMLELDYLGQQNIIANRQIRENPLDEEDQWAKALAKASFEKVFPTYFRQRLPRLSLRDILAYPPVSAFDDERKRFSNVLERWSWDPDSGNAKFGENKLPQTPPRLSQYLSRMAVVVRKLSFHLPLATYRTTQQSWDSICSIADTDDRARHAVARILGGAEYDELVETTGSDKTATATRRIKYKQKGRLIARFNEQFSVPIGLDYRIDLSAGPEFQVLPPASRTIGFVEPPTDIRRSQRSASAEVRRSQAILAVSLQEDSYNVQAPDMSWEMERALVWTFHYRPYFMDFSWPSLIHPSPLRLMSWSRDWDRVINAVRKLPKQDRARTIAYAWISYQLKWTGGLSGKIDLSITPTDDQFRKLLSQPAPHAWVQLARPEIGLPLDLQNLILEDVPEDRKKEMRQERRQKITDALITGGQALLGDHAQVRERVIQIEQEFETQLDSESRTSPWADKVGLTDSKDGNKA